MKFLFASDIHGDLAAAEAVKRAFSSSGAKRLVLLGDLLYHGPRNDLPKEYNPRAVIELLNGLGDRILAVRGNCDAEVDQMVLSFPIMADYAVLPLGHCVAYLTHGHHYHKDALPPMGEGDVLVHGHTHVAGIVRAETGHAVLNPGSASMPKENTPPSYLLFDTETGIFTLHRLADDVVWASLEL